MSNNVNPIPILGEAKNQDGFISEAEILALVPVSRRTWYDWRRAGKVPYVQLGRKLLYHWDSVRKALLRQQRGGAQ